ncbi:hypothetical protein [Streptomyces sp. NPDC098781]|uniref:hypothetical protein n=1 Tax=Streptomyces sp. NPDC098781 TaxID=3366097 RepID=UPI0037F4DC45
MRAPRTLRTTLIAAGVTTALSVSAAGVFAAEAPTSTTVPPAAHPSKAERTYVTTVELADKVSRAKIYKTGENRYEAEIWAKGARYGTLYTQGLPTHAQHNGLHVTLHPNGKVTSWVEHAEAQQQRQLIGTATLADGTTTAKIHRIADDHYEADLATDGTRLDTLVADGRTAYGENNTLHVALRPDGRLTSWLDESP